MLKRSWAVSVACGVAVLTTAACDPGTIRVEGTVRDQVELTGIPGAEVQVWLMGWSRAYNRSVSVSPPVAEVLTDERGHFDLAFPVLDGCATLGWTLWVFADGYSSSSGELPADVACVGEVQVINVDLFDPHPHQ